MAAGWGWWVGAEQDVAGEAMVARRFGHAEHLVRLAGLFVVGISAFLVVRAVAVPEGFGRHGHFRAGALDDNRAQQALFAGRQACADCHDDVAATAADGAHAGVGCESCHGALATHALDDPGAQTPVALEPLAVCMVCHRLNAGKAAGFPQVDAEEHAAGEDCTLCHDPHSPL